MAKFTSLLNGKDRGYMLSMPRLVDQTFSCRHLIVRSSGTKEKFIPFRHETSAWPMLAFDYKRDPYPVSTSFAEMTFDHLISWSLAPPLQRFDISAATIPPVIKNLSDKVSMRWYKTELFGRIALIPEVCLLEREIGPSPAWAQILLSPFRNLAIQSHSTTKNKVIVEVRDDGTNRISHQVCGCLAAWAGSTNGFDGLDQLTQNVIDGKAVFPSSFYAAKESRVFGFNYGKYFLIQSIRADANVIRSWNIDANEVIILKGVDKIAIAHENTPDWHHGSRMAQSRRISEDEKFHWYKVLSKQLY